MPIIVSAYQGNISGDLSWNSRQLNDTCFSLTFTDHLQIFVGLSSLSFSSTVSFQSCQLSVNMLSYLPGCCRSIYVRPPLLFAGITMSFTFLERLFSSLLSMCTYQFNFFCSRNVEIWHTLASSCVTWFLTWSFLVLHLIRHSIFIFAICNMFSSFFLTAQHSAP